MVNGIGYFTIDAIKPTVVSLQTMDFSNLSQQPQITFNSNTSGSSFYQLVLDCDNTAKTGTGSDDGVLITVSAVDINGKVITNYNNQITISITDPNSLTTSLFLAKGAGTLSGNYYTYNPADNGEVVFRLKDSVPEEWVQAILDSNSARKKGRCGEEKLASILILSKGTRPLIPSMIRLAKLSISLSNLEPIPLYSVDKTP